MFLKKQKEAKDYSQNHKQLGLEGSFVSKQPRLPRLSQQPQQPANVWKVLAQESREVSYSLDEAAARRRS